MPNSRYYVHVVANDVKGYSSSNGSTQCITDGGKEQKNIFIYILCWIFRFRFLRREEGERTEEEEDLIGII